MSFWKLIRYPNLLIVLLTQCLFYGFILQVFHTCQIEPSLDWPHFLLLSLTTICIAAAGYVINDITDYKIDQINKPDRMLINKTISKTQAQMFYYLLVAGGALMAIYLAWYVNNMQLFLIYPVASGLMWYYSKSLKKKPLSGNIIVALFSAFVAGIVWFAERAGFAQLSSSYGIQMQNLFLFYMVFAFCATLFREVIKDIEDYEGDLKGDCQTLPILLGIPIARKICLGFGTLLLLSILYWLGTQWMALSWSLLVLTIGLLLVPSVFVLAVFYKAADKAAYHRSSQICKGVMLAGLLYLLLFLFLN